MSNQLKKTVVITLLVTMVFSTSFFIQPKKADAAATSCLMSALGSLVATIGGALSSIMSVPVADRPTETSSGTGAMAGVGTNLGECLLKAVARAAAQTLIHNFTQSTLAWINSGFHGSPTFITNPEAFLSNVGDIAAGQFLQGLGPVGQILCSPFDLKLRVSLGLSLGTGNGAQYQYIGCRLSDVQKNIYDPFVGGRWGTKGWQNFVSISQGSNNPYGAYLYGKDAMNQQIASKVGLKQQEIQMGSGFLNQEKCYDNITGSEVDPNDPYDLNYTCETVTPGSVIQSQLNKTLGSPVDVLSVSQDIDDILNALVNQGITQVFSATGLLGMSRPSAQYNGHTYLARMAATYQGQLAAGHTLPPAGIDCRNTYRVNSNPATGDVTSVDVLVTTGGTGTWQASTVVVPPGTSAASYQNQITLGCQNLAAAEPVQNEVNGLGGPGGILSGGNTNNTCAQGIPSQINNLTGGQPIFASYAPSWQPVTVLVDGNLGNSLPGTSMSTQASELSSNNFFEITLAHPSDIRYLLISPDNNANVFDIRMAGTNIYFYNQVPAAPIYNSASHLFNFDSTGLVKTVAVSPSSQVQAPPGITYDGKSPFYIGSGLQSIVLDDINTHQFNNLTGITHIIVQRPFNFGDGLLDIAEFQAFGYDLTNSGSNSSCGTTGPTHSAAAITSQNVTNLNIYQGNSFNNNGNLTIASSQNLPNLNIQTSLVKVVGTATTSVPMDSVFNTFSESRAIVYGQSNQEILFPPASASNPTQAPSTPPSSLSGISLVATAPDPAQQNYYITVGGGLLTNAPLGTYQLIVRATESGTGLDVGTQTYTFTILSTTQ